MNLLFKKTGGIRISGNYGFWDITWPFVTLEIFDDKITITINIKKRFLYLYVIAKLFKLNKVITFKFTEIDSIHRLLYLPIIADGIQINHHTDYPKCIIFWSFFSSTKIINILKEKGIKIE